MHTTPNAQGVPHDKSIVTMWLRGLYTYCSNGTFVESNSRVGVRKSGSVIANLDHNQGSIIRTCSQAPIMQRPRMSHIPNPFSKCMRGMLCVLIRCSPYVSCDVCLLMQS